MDLDKIFKRLTPIEREFVSNLIEKDALTGIYNRRKFDHDIGLVVSMSDYFVSEFLFLFLGEV